MRLVKLLRGLISQFPDAIPYINSESQRPNPTTEKIVTDTIQLWNLGIPNHIHERFFTYGHSIATTAYHHVQSPALQAQIALFTGLAILVDDGIMGIPPLLEFVSRFTSGSPQLHPSLDRFAETVRGLSKYFTPYGANAILSSTIGYVNSELFERELSDMQLSVGSGRYADYTRERTGYVEAYAVFVWPKDEFPDTQEYIQAFPSVHPTLIS